MDLSLLLTAALAQTTFSGGGVSSPEDLRSTSAGSSWGSEALRQVLGSRPHVPDHLVEPLTVALRGRLTPYVDLATDRIGHSFRISGGGHGLTRATSEKVLENQSTSSLSGVALGLVRVAAIIGPAAAADLFDGWVRGEPLRFKICLLLGGAYVADDLELGAGLRLHALATSSEGLPPAMPDVDYSRVDRLLGHPLLEIDASTHPVFFPPPKDDDPFPKLESVTTLSPASIDDFLMALSLVCDRKVGMAWAWNDFGPAGLFATGKASGLMGPGSVPTRRLGRGYSYSPETNIMTIARFDAPPPDLFASRLWRAWELLPYLHDRQRRHPRFRIAVIRWHQSSSASTPLVDRVVDLRIALESLFLDSDSGELGFRLATTAARYLGTGLVERRAIRKTVSDFYGLASRVIHGTDLNLAQGSDADLVSRAGRLCRDGILKVLEERCQPVWSDLLLA